MTAVCTVGPWIVLWWLGEPRKFRQSIGGGLLFTLLASFLDDYGVSEGLWWYPEQPIPLMTGNAAWNIIAAAATATLVVEKALAKPQQVWGWVIGMALATGATEFFLLYTTDLLAYPRWSPLFSIPCYVLLFWTAIGYTRWVWAAPQKPQWNPPEA